MPSTRKRRPKYRRQARHGRADTAFVEIDSKRHHLGVFDSDESWAIYHQLLAEHARNGKIEDNAEQLASFPLTVTELCLAYWERHAQPHYRKPDGSETTTAAQVRTAIKRLRTMYGPTPAAEFGPLKLKRLRTQMIEAKLARSTINQETRMIRDVFRWGVSEEIVPATVHQALGTVRGLQAGRSGAKENRRIKPVPIANVHKTQKHVSPQISALIDLQLLTGARGGELLNLRPIDIDTTGDVWAAEIREHKTAWKDRQRVIYFGPKAQNVLRSFLTGRALQAYLFSPIEAERERRAADASGGRRDGQPETPRKSDRKINDRYTSNTYAQAIRRGAEAAGVPHWTPHQLRHTRATELRKQFGLEVAQVVLGHSHASVTQVYAERDNEKARQIAAENG